MKTGLPPLHGDDLTFGNIRNIDVRRSGGPCRCVGAHLGDQRPGRETSAHSAHRDVRDAEKVPSGRFLWYRALCHRVLEPYRFVIIVA